MSSLDLISSINPSSTNNTDNTNNTNKPMGRTRYNISIAVIVIVLIAIIILLIFMITEPTIAQKLASNGWQVYYKPGCKYCDLQKSELGHYPLSVVCDGNDQTANKSSMACKDVTGFPYWVNIKTGKTKVGLQKKESLIRMINEK